MKFLIISFIIIFNFQTLNAVEFFGKFKQGSFILGKIKPNSIVKVDNKKIRVSKQGYFAFGLDRDRNNNVIIKIKENGKTKIIEKKVFKRKYKIQRIEGLAKKHVTPPPEVYEQIKKDNILIGKARSIDTPYDFFKNKFIYPVHNYWCLW